MCAFLGFANGWRIGLIRVVSGNYSTFYDILFNREVYFVRELNND